MSENYLTKEILLEYYERNFDKDNISENDWLGWGMKSWLL